MPTGKRKFLADWGVPLFVALRGAACGKANSKIETILRRQSANKTSAKYHWMTEVCYRYLRRNKNSVLAAYANDFRNVFSKRYGATSYFYEAMPSSDTAIGFLAANDKLQSVTATAVSTLEKPDIKVVKAAAFRGEKLYRLMKKKDGVSGDALNAQIIAWELSVFLKLKERENDERESISRRSVAAKQAWIRRQQNKPPTGHGASDSVACKDYVSCNQ